MDDRVSLVSATMKDMILASVLLAGTGTKARRPAIALGKDLPGHIHGTFLKRLRSHDVIYRPDHN